MTTTVTVMDVDGLSGTVEADGRLEDRTSQVLVQLADGRQVLVPTNILQRREDGSYFLPLSLANVDQFATSLEAGETHIIPVIEEHLKVEKRLVETGGVRVTKQVHEREEVVDEALWQEQVEVEHVPINQVVEGPLAMRQEGDTLIIPLVEEVLVVEKRLVLKEELHITRRRVETHALQRVTLRHETAEVEDLGPVRGEGIGTDSA